MELKELLQFIEFENDRLNKHFRNGRSEEEWFSLELVKLMEEVGELCNEFLRSKGVQRKEKTNGIDNLPDELADVIIGAFLLANTKKIDIEKSLEEGIRKRKRRNY